MSRALKGKGSPGAACHLRHLHDFRARLLGFLGLAFQEEPKITGRNAVKRHAISLSTIMASETSGKACKMCETMKRTHLPSSCLLPTIITG